MLVYTERSLHSFDAWSGAITTKQNIINAGLGEDFDTLIEELYPEGLNEMLLNDILRFDYDWVYHSLGMAEYVSPEYLEENE